MQWIVQGIWVGGKGAPLQRGYSTPPRVLQQRLRLKIPAYWRIVISIPIFKMVCLRIEVLPGEPQRDCEVGSSCLIPLIFVTLRDDALIGVIRVARAEVRGAYQPAHPIRTAILTVRDKWDDDMSSLGLHPRCPDLTTVVATNGRNGEVLKRVPVPQLGVVSRPILNVNHVEQDPHSQ